MNAPHPPHPFTGLELVTAGVLVLDRALTLQYANPAAESLLAFSLRNVHGQALTRVLPGAAALHKLLAQVVESNAGVNENELVIELSANTPLRLGCVVTPLDEARVVVELRPLDQQLKIVREEKILEHQKLNRELIRNLAHEIKNPLGGIRGAAQLLEHELTESGRSELNEYTQVIREEALRLTALMDRLLTPHRIPEFALLNIHEVLERVRALLLAEFPRGIVVKRDYDISLPEIVGDRERLIQAVLNVVRNAAQAMEGRGEIALTTRVARQVTLNKQRYRHAILVSIGDNGPGVPPTLQDQIFYPLVSGREGGTGLGLSLAQDFINQHHGIIEFTSAPGETRFDILLPVRDIKLAA